MNRVAPTIAIAAALAVLAPAAAAKPVKSPAASKYAVTITGSQVQTWEYHRPDDPEDPCDTANDGYGSQTIRFSGRGKHASLVAFPVSDELRAETGGRPFVAASARLHATAERESDYVSSGDTSHCPGDNGGGVEPVQEQRDCGERDGLIDLRVSAHESEDTGELFVPLIPKDGVAVGGTVVGYGSTLGSLDPEYRNCEGWIGGPPSRAWHDGAIAQVIERLPYRKLLSPKTRQLVVDGGDVTCFDENGSVACGREAGPFKGRVVTAFKLVLKRKR